MTTSFAKTSPAPIAFDKALGLCFGWFCFSKQAGVEYDDLHGDHFPDDELLKAVDALMAKPAAEREINVEHAGGARGSIATAQALTEDVAKALGIDTGGNYGIVGSFRPDAELLKSIEAGERFCLSIEGAAHNVETVAKSADGAEVAKGRKRIMRGVELTKLAVVKAGAHQGASVALIKSARAAVAARFAKATPAATSVEAGHQHLIADIDEQTGCTSWDSMPGSSEYGSGHSHTWLRGADGAVAILMANGHTHTLLDSTTGDSPMADLNASAADLAKAQADIAKRDARLATLLGLPADQLAFAKRLDAAGLSAFLDAPVADRTARATPIHKSERSGRVFFAGDEALVEVVKDADLQHAETAIAKAATKSATFEKRAQTELGNLPGTAAELAVFIKAAEGETLTVEERTALLAKAKAFNVAYGSVFKAVGVNGGDPIAKGALAAFDAGLAEFAKSIGKDADLVADDFLATPKGAELYAAYEAERRPRA